MLRPHEIDLRAPVEPGHPLNRGRVLWLSAHPFISGGAAWRDLCQRYAGTLAGGAAWVAGRADLTADAHRVELAPASGGSTAWAWAVDAAVMSGTADNGAVFGRAYNTSQGQFYYRTATSRLDYWEGGSLRIAGATAGSVPVGTRVRLLFVRDGTAAMLYANGVLVGSGTASSSAALAADTLAIGRETIGSAAARMRVYESAAWNRALTENEVWADYEAARRGYPGLGGPLRRVSNRRSLLLRDSDAGGGGTATTLDVDPAAVALAGAANFLLAANAAPGAAAVAGSAGFGTAANASPAAVTVAGTAAFGVTLDAAAGAVTVAGGSGFGVELNATPAALTIAGHIDLALSGVVVLNVEPAVVTLAGSAAFGLGLGVTPATVVVAGSAGFGLALDAAPGAAVVAGAADFTLGAGFTPAAVTVAGGSAFGIGLAATPGSVVVAGTIDLVWSEVSAGGSPAAGTLTLTAVAGGTLTLTSLPAGTLTLE